MGLVQSQGGPPPLSQQHCRGKGRFHKTPLPPEILIFIGRGFSGAFLTRFLAFATTA